MIQDSITFNSYKTTGVPTDQWPFFIAGQQGPDEDGGVINAVNIDWNEANLSSAASSFANAADTAPVSTITTTGESMKGVYSPMFAKAA